MLYHNAFALWLTCILCDIQTPVQGINERTYEQLLTGEHAKCKDERLTIYNHTFVVLYRRSGTNKWTLAKG